MRRARISTHFLSPSSRQFARLGIFLLGLCATIYMSFLTVGPISVRLVQIAPLCIGSCAFLFVHVPKAEGARFYLGLPIVWAAYVGSRHVADAIWTDVLTIGAMEGTRSVINVIAYLTAVRLFQLTRTSRYLMLGLVCGCLLSVAACLLVPSMGSPSVVMGNGRWQGFMPGANRLGGLSAASMVICVSTLLAPATWRMRGLTLAILAISGLGVVMSGSRGAILSLCPALLLVIVAHANRRKGALLRTAAVTLLGIVAMLVAFTAFRNAIPERIVSLATGANSAFSEMHEDARMETFSIALQFFLENPVFGGGPDVRVFNLGGGTTSAHNAYLYQLASAGIIGLMTYLALPCVLLLGLVAAHWRGDTSPYEHREIIEVMALMVLALTHGLVMDTSQLTYVWLIFAAAAHLCIAAKQREGFRAVERQKDRDAALAPGMPLADG